jgi:hypothetical protein
MTSGPRSGKHGAVHAPFGTAVDAIDNWVLTENNTPEDQVHSASAGGHNRSAGVSDWTANFSGFGGAPAFFPGDRVDLRLFTSPDTGVYGSNGREYSGFGYVDQLTIDWDWTAGGSIKYSAQVSADGCLATALVDAIDTLSECKYRMCTLVPQVATTCVAPSFVPWPNVKSASLTITADNQMFANSSTACCTFRQAGNIDWTFDVVDEETDRFLVTGDFYDIKFFVSPTLFWRLQFGIAIGIGNLNVNVTTGEIISKSNMVQMSGQICCSGSPTAGAIINPAAVTKWPIPPA